MIEAFIFDMDGVLIDSERVCRDIWTSIGEEVGITGMHEIYKEYIGRNRTDAIRLMQPTFGPFIDPALFMERVAAAMDAYLDTHPQGFPLKEGIFELLSYLKTKKVPMLVCSSTRGSRVRRNLEQSGILSFFDEIISGDMVTRSKPDPEIYLKACRAAGFMPAQCCAVEDSPNGVRSAKAAGMCVFMVPDLLEPSEEILSLTDQVFDSHEKLLEALKKQETL